MTTMDPRLIEKATRAIGHDGISNPATRERVARTVLDAVADDIARAERERVLAAVETLLPSPGQLAETRARIKAIYSNAVERGLLLGSVDVDERFATRLRTLIARLRDGEVQP